jgi:hypothetical protein
MDIKQLLVIAAAAAMVFLGISLGQVYWRRRIGRWARARGFQLVSFQGAKFYEGPSAFGRTESRDEFHIVVQDAQGNERPGWHCIGSNWNPFGLAVEILWDDGGRNHWPV